MRTEDEAEPSEVESPSYPWELAEVLGAGLTLIFAVLIATGVASAAVLLATFGPEHVNGSLGFINSSVVGQAFLQGTFWSGPQIATIFVLGSLGLAWWQIESWTDDEGKLVANAAPHIGRARSIVKAGLVMSILCALGGLLSVIGSNLVTSPGDNWTVFVENIGLTIGSFLLGGIGTYASVHLLRSVGD